MGWGGCLFLTLFTSSAAGSQGSFQDQSPTCRAPGSGARQWRRQPPRKISSWLGGFFTLTHPGLRHEVSQWVCGGADWGEEFPPDTSPSLGQDDGEGYAACPPPPGRSAQRGKVSQPAAATAATATATAQGVRLRERERPAQPSSLRARSPPPNPRPSPGRAGDGAGGRKQRRRPRRRQQQQEQ